MEYCDRRAREQIKTRRSFAMFAASRNRDMNVMPVQKHCSCKNPKE